LYSVVAFVVNETCDNIGLKISIIDRNSEKLCSRVGSPPVIAILSIACLVVNSSITSNIDLISIWFTGWVKFREQPNEHLALQILFTSI
jgi:hypothetical protein